MKFFYGLTQDCTTYKTIKAYKQNHELKIVEMCMLVVKMKNKRPWEQT